MVYYLIQFVIMMTCIYAKLVSAAHMNRFIKSYYIYIVFLVLYLKTMSFRSLKIMKKSPITKYSDTINYASICNLASEKFLQGTLFNLRTNLFLYLFD